MDEHASRDVTPPTESLVNDMTGESDKTPLDDPRDAGRQRGPRQRGRSAITSAWAWLRAPKRGLLDDSGVPRRVPSFTAAVGLAAALSAAIVGTAAAVPSSPDRPGTSAGPPAIVAQPGTEQSKIVTAARGELGTPETGDGCQKYSSQCVAWCALFATSMWEKAGVQVDSEQFAFTGDLYTTGQARGAAYDSDQLRQARPGDVLLFGTGPQTPSTSKHVGVVEKVQGNTVTLIEGNTGDNPDRVMRKEHRLSPDTFYGGVHPW